MLSMTPDMSEWDRRAVAREAQESATSREPSRVAAMVAKPAAQRCVRRPLAAALEPPLAHPRVVARQEHLGHRVPVPVERARVVRVLGRALERLAERLLDARSPRARARRGASGSRRRRPPSPPARRRTGRTGRSRPRRWRAARARARRSPRSGRTAASAPARRPARPPARRRTAARPAASATTRRRRGARAGRRRSAPRSAASTTSTRMTMPAPPP